jgi:hypothetical protein
LQLQVAGPRTQPEWCPSYLSGDDSPGNYFGDCDTQAVSPQYIFLRLSKLVRNVPFLGFKSPPASRPSPPHIPARDCSSLYSSTSPPGWILSLGDIIRRVSTGSRDIRPQGRPPGGRLIYSQT